jgi:hypothetical protein
LVIGGNPRGDMIYDLDLKVSSPIFFITWMIERGILKMGCIFTILQGSTSPFGERNLALKKRISSLP